MKKTTTLVAVFLSVLLLTACGNNSNDSNESNNSKSSNVSNTRKVIQSKKITGNTVGLMSMTVNRIVQEKVNKNDDKTDAEYNFQGLKSFPKEYYRTTFTYSIKNVGNDSLGLDYMSDFNLVDNDGQQFSDQSNEFYGLNEWGSSNLKPSRILSGKYIALSKSPINLSKYSFDTGEQIKNSDTTLNDGGTIDFK